MSRAVVALGIALCFSATGYDYRTDSEICTLIFSWTTREVELQFDHPGEASIRLVGRRIAGEDFGGGKEIVIEHHLTVH